MGCWVVLTKTSWQKIMAEWLVLGLTLRRTPELVDLQRCRHLHKKGWGFHMCRLRLRNFQPLRMCCTCASLGGGHPWWDSDVLHTPFSIKPTTWSTRPVTIPRMIGLSRSVANELVLAAILHPLMITDLGCKYHSSVFATDASSKRGAICSCPVDATTAEVLWKTSKSKGSYTRLLSPSEELLRRLGIHEENDTDNPIEDAGVGPSRPLA